MNAPKDIEIITAALAEVGFTMLSSEAGTMDSGQAVYSNGVRTIRILKDKSRWMLDGTKTECEPFGLWRAFNSTTEFRNILLAFAARRIN